MVPLNFVGQVQVLTSKRKHRMHDNETTLCKANELPFDSNNHSKDFSSSNGVISHAIPEDDQRYNALKEHNRSLKDKSSRPSVHRLHSEGVSSVRQLVIDEDEIERSKCDNCRRFRCSWRRLSHVVICVLILALCSFISLYVVEVTRVRIFSHNVSATYFDYEKLISGFKYELKYLNS